MTNRFVVIPMRGSRKFSVGGGGVPRHVYDSFYYVNLIKFYFPGGGGGNILLHLDDLCFSMKGSDRIALFS